MAVTTITITDENDAVKVTLTGGAKESEDETPAQFLASIMMDNLDKMIKVLGDEPA